MTGLRARGLAVGLWSNRVALRPRSQADCRSLSTPLPSLQFDPLSPQQLREVARLQVGHLHLHRPPGCELSTSACGMLVGLTFAGSWLQHHAWQRN